MENKNTRHREPLIRIAKRDGLVWWKGWMVRAIAIIAALIVCGILVVCITGVNPFEFYGSMISGSFGSARKIWMTMQKTAILLCISLAVTPAFKMKFWNTGAEGQVLMGALASAACMIWWGGSLPNWLLLPVMAVVCMIAGIIWSVIPAFFKAHWGTNETLFTLMMNYVATQLVSYAITFWENPAGSNSVGVINPNTYAGWLPSLLGQKYLLNILITLAVLVIVYIYLSRAKQGYEISVVGESQNTARYIGIDVKKVIIRTMIFTGAICGIAGMLLVAGTDHSIATNTVGGQGFTAIMVSWLAKFNPIVMGLTSFLIVFLERGAGEIATAFRLNESVAEILTGIILFFIIGSEFFVSYQVNFRRAHKEGKIKND